MNAHAEGLRRRLPVVWALLALACGGAFGLHRIAELDLFEQVAVGRAVLSDPGSIGVSTFHHTLPGYRYVEDKWLASVLAALADRLGGESGLMLYQICLAALLGLAWFVAFHTWGGDGRVALFATALCCAACAFRIEPRPETFSAIALALLLALLAASISFRRRLLAVALVFLLWVQLHGYFVAGLLVLGAALCEAGITGEPGAPRAQGGRGDSSRRALLLLGVALASCFTHPQGAAALRSPLEQISMLRSFPYLRQAIQEFQPSTALFFDFGPLRWALLACTVAAGVLLDRFAAGRRAPMRALAGVLAAAPWIAFPPDGLQAWPYRVTFALIAAAVIEIPWHLRQRRLLPVFLLAGFTLLAIPLIRNISFLPPLALLLLVPTWVGALREGGRRWWRLPTLAGASAVVLLIAWARLADRLAPGSEAYPALTGWGIEERVFPVRASDFVLEQDLPEHLLNHFDLGGYLLYRLHPRSSVFISGNTSMYPPAFFREYHRAVLGRDADVEALVSRFGVRTAVLGLASPEIEILAGKLSRSSTWRLVFLDRSAAVYVHGEESTRDLVERLAVDLDRRVEALARGGFDRSPLPSWLGARRRPQEALRLGRYLRLAGRGDLAVTVALAGWRDVGADRRLASFLGAAADDPDLAARVVEPLEWLAAMEPGSSFARSRLARSRYVRGVERLAQGDLAAAEVDLGRSRDLAPAEPGPWVALARLEVERGNLPGARSLLRQGLERAGGRPVGELLAGDPILLELAEADSGR